MSIKTDVIFVDFQEGMVSKNGFCNWPPMDDNGIRIFWHLWRRLNYHQSSIYIWVIQKKKTKNETSRYSIVISNCPINFASRFGYIKVYGISCFWQKLLSTTTRKESTYIPVSWRYGGTDNNLFPSCNDWFYNHQISTVFRSHFFFSLLDR